MARMVNPIEEEKKPSSSEAFGEAENDLEDTKPRRIRPAEKIETPQSDEDPLSETSPTVVAPGALESDSISQTQPMAAGEPSPNESGFALEDDPTLTQPTLRIEADDEPPPGFENTLPPPDTFAYGAQVVDEGEGVSEPAVSTLIDSAVSGKKAVRKKKSPGKKSRRNRSRWFLIPVLGLLAIFMIAGASAFGGYASGIGLRRNAERTQVELAAEQQFQLGIEDMAVGNYHYARQRFEYVLSKNPNYPGATEKLAEVLLYLNATATSTLLPTPTITPTSDTRAIEELFGQAQQASLDKNWDGAVDYLLSLRQKDPNFRPIEVDGMLFLALRNRGKDKIVSADLESGIYDLTLASNFAPLDSEAKGLLTWSQLYITGASFWEIDWAQVVDYFSQVAPQMPNLTDSSGMSASERYRLALYNYGNQFAQQGQFCKALEYYTQSLQIRQDAEVQSAWEQATKGCEGGGAQGQETPKPGKKKTPTAQPAP